MARKRLVTTHDTHDPVMELLAETEWHIQGWCWHVTPEERTGMNERPRPRMPEALAFTAENESGVSTCLVSHGVLDLIWDLDPNHPMWELDKSTVEVELDLGDAGHDTTGN